MAGHISNGKWVDARFIGAICPHCSEFDGLERKNEVGIFENYQCRRCDGMSDFTRYDLQFKRGNHGPIRNSNDLTKCCVAKPYEHKVFRPSQGLYLMISLPV